MDLNRAAKHIGTRIRAYDFEPCLGRPECFVEGPVIAVGESTHLRPPTKEVGYERACPGTGYSYNAFLIKCEEDTDRVGEHSRVGEYVLVPIETTFDYQGRILFLV